MTVNSVSGMLVESNSSIGCPLLLSENALDIERILELIIVLIDIEIRSVALNFLSASSSFECFHLSNPQLHLSFYIYISVTTALQD